MGMTHKPTAWTLKLPTRRCHPVLDRGCSRRSDRDLSVRIPSHLYRPHRRRSWNHGSGHCTCLCLVHALETTEANLEDSVDRELLEPATVERAFERIAMTESLEVATAGGDLVIETVPERLNLI